MEIQKSKQEKKKKDKETIVTIHKDPSLQTNITIFEK